MSPMKHKNTDRNGISKNIHTYIHTHTQTHTPNAQKDNIENS